MMIDHNYIWKKIKNNSLFSSIIFFESIPSTNTFLKKNISSIKDGTVVIALNQTAGKGTRNRKWISKAGSSLTFSLLLKVEFFHLSFLTLFIGVCIAKSINRLKPNILNLKWPNDLYVEKNKVGGILVESIHHNNKKCDVIIGVGINLSSFNKGDHSYHSIGITDYSINQICILILKEINAEIKTLFENPNLIVKRWNKLNMFKNKEVIVRLKDKKIFGTFIKIDFEKNLIIRHKTKMVRIECEHIIDIKQYE